jgi:hypothetical protein
MTAVWSPLSEAEVRRTGAERSGGGVVAPERGGRAGRTAHGLGQIYSWRIETEFTLGHWNQISLAPLP